MKILGVGLSRTGTTSLSKALRMLGYSVTHFEGRFFELLSSSELDLSRYDDVDALTDIPTALYYKEFMQRYSELKLILTIRNEQDWLRSIVENYRRLRTSPLTKGPDGAVHKARMLAFGTHLPDTRMLLNRYREWNKQVIDTVSAEQLLVLDVNADNKFELLCQFLGKDVPSEPYPRLNRYHKEEVLPEVKILPGTGNRVDVHVLSHKSKPSWLRQTLDSLKSEPCTTYVVRDGFPLSIGAARAFAFTLGEAEYVSFTDDDDYVLPGAMQQCVDYLDANPAVVGVYTDRYALAPNGVMEEQKLPPWTWQSMCRRFDLVTHLKVMRRSAVMPYLDEIRLWPTWEEYVLCCSMVEQGPWVHLPIFGAVKRRRPASESSMRLSSKALMDEAKELMIRRVIGATK